MVTEAVDQEVNIGAVAGMIWHHLDQNGPMTFAKLTKDLDAPRDLVMQGIGWLAREGKLRFEESARSKTVGLV